MLGWGGVGWGAVGVAAMNAASILFAELGAFQRQTNMETYLPICL